MYISHTCLGSLDCTTTNKIYFDYSSTTLGAKVNNSCSSLGSLAHETTNRIVCVNCSTAQGAKVSSVIIAVLALAPWSVEQQIRLFVSIVALPKEPWLVHLFKYDC